MITQQDRALAFGRALESVPPVFAAQDVFEWLHSNAEWVEDVWIEGRLAADTVNDHRRQHMPGPRDVLFGRVDGRYERYDPAMHGWWSDLGRPSEAETQGASVTHLIVPSTAAGSRTAVRYIRHRKAG